VHCIVGYSIPCSVLLLANVSDCLCIPYTKLTKQAYILQYVYSAVSHSEITCQCVCKLYLSETGQSWWLSGHIVERTAALVLPPCHPAETIIKNQKELLILVQSLVNSLIKDCFKARQTETSCSHDF